MSINKTVLLTGTRAPIALDLARLFWKAGLRVICVDSLKHTACRYSKAVDRYYQIASPVFNLEGFKWNLNEIIEREHVDLLIPMCEEVLYVAKIQDELLSDVFCMAFDDVEQLHNKWTFYLWLKKHGFKTPLTYLLEDRPLNQKVVLKRIYSRFGAHIHIVRAGQKLLDLDSQPQNIYIAQDFIEGEKLCSYSVAIDGHLCVHTAYVPLQTLGKGASIAFKNIEDTQVFAFVDAFVKLYQYTGQVSFDFIRSKDGTLYCIECNPRATSGLHFFKGMDEAAEGFFKPLKDYVLPKKEISFRDPLFSLWYGMQHGDVFQKSFWKMLFTGDHPFKDDDDRNPYRALPKVFGEVLQQSLLKGKSFRTGLSYDLEYNGDER